MKEGDRFEGYLLKNKLGEGGMAEVFRAERVGEDGVVREVCIKRIHPHLAKEASIVEMFVEEARIASKLRHGNIVAVEDYGRHEGAPFMVMSWVNGVDASALLKRLLACGQSMPVDAALHIVSCILRGLEYAHGKRDERGDWLRIVHRDVSPHNVLISFSGEVLVSDFGIARATSRLHQTDRFVVKGKLSYMAPEQAAGLPLDHRADLFAVGVVAYELLTGRLPFGGGSDAKSTASAMVRGARVPLRALRPEVPLEVDAFVDRMLELIPDDRYVDAAAARDALSATGVSSMGERSLQRLMRGLFSDDMCSTILPLTMTAPLAFARAMESPGTVFVELAATLPASPVASPLPNAVTRALGEGVVRPVPVEASHAQVTAPGRLAPPQRAVVSEPTAPNLASSATSSPDPSGPFVAVSRVAPRRRSRALFASALVGVGVALVASGYFAATLSTGSRAAAAATSFPSHASSVTFTFGPNGNAGSGFTVSNTHDADDAHARADRAALRERATSSPFDYGTVRVVAVPSGSVAVDDGPWNANRWTYTLSAGRHHARALIHDRTLVTSDFTVHVGHNPDVTLGPPAVHAPQ